jgi:hypothetical protein
MGLTTDFGQYRLYSRIPLALSEPTAKLSAPDSSALGVVADLNGQREAPSLAR